MTDEKYIRDLENFADKEIRPYLLNHGGDLRIVSFSEKTLRIKLVGQCMICPASQATFDDIIKAKFKEKFGFIDDIILVNDVSDSLLDTARKILNHEL